jgi:hypothetical protein
MITTLVVLAIVFVLVCRYPPIGLLVLAVTNVAGDGFALNSFLRVSGYETLAIWLRAPAFVASAIACYKILSSRRNDEEMGRTQMLVLVILGVSAWVGLALLIKGKSIQVALGTVMSSGFLMAPIVLAYWREHRARALFVALLLIQLSLAAAVVLMPDSPFGLLSGTKYSSGLGDLSGVSQTFNGDVSRVSDQPRMFAQFNDPIGYGLYSVIGVVIGAYICLSGRQFRHRVLGGILIALAGFGYIVTVNRGTTFGLLAGLLIIMISEAARRRVILTVVLWLLVMLLAGTTYLLLRNERPSSAILDVFFVSSTDVSVTGRVDAVKVGWQGIVGDPLFGVPLSFIWPRNVAPHQLMVYFAAVFGVPAGMFVTMLLWVIMQIRMQYLDVGLSKDEKWMMHLSVIIGWIVLGTGMTNNCAVPALFWMSWAIGCLPWLKPWQQYNRATVLDAALETRRRLAATLLSV